jgi:cell division protein FtsB
MPPQSIVDAHAYNLFMSHLQVSRIQEDLERSVQALKVATDPDERKTLFRKIRRLIEEADHLAEQNAS